MSRQCNLPHCFAPDVSCHLGNLNLIECDAWQGGAAETNEVVEGADSPDGVSLPWSGNSLGSVDTPFVAGRSNPLVIGVVGAQNAGKTTLLAALYLLLGYGYRPAADKRFAGSYTLLGWENIAHSLRWEGNGGLAFPLHTASAAGRMPGLLHLAFRQPGGQLSDFLLTDAPGEWFRRWAMDRDAPDADGARWVGEHADVLLLVADSESLAGPQRGSARNIFQLLAQRLGAERKERPTALIWSKADVVVPPEIRTAVMGAVRRAIPDAREFSISVYPPKPDRAMIESDRKDSGVGFVELFDWLMTVRRPPVAIPRTPLIPTDSMWSFGR